MPAESNTAQNCLIVDDEPRLRQVLVHLMRNDGFTCLEAGNGEEALAHLEQQPMTLVMSDLRMPKMDGLELLRRVRGRWPDTAVVMITAVADVEVAVSCLAIGAMDYLTKPFHLEEIRARVAQALEKRRLVMENRGYQESLQEKVAVQARRLEELFLASIQSLAEALEVKDPYTRGHSERVHYIAMQIGEAMHLSTRDTDDLFWGSLLHDVGKIGIPDAVLCKPGRLTRDEFTFIMVHPERSYDILRHIDQLKNAVPGVRHHHEMWDGMGYPHGLAGDRIPLHARIMAVADTYDSITSSRAYRAGRPHEVAMAEIARVSGTQLDPSMVEVFAKICAAEPEWLERFNIRRERAFIDPRGAPRVDRGPDYTRA